MDGLEEHRSQIAALCARWQVRELSVFGSAARGELRPDSDVDVLVSFSPCADWDLLDLLHMQDELEALLGRSVDMVEREAIEESENWIVRREILGTAELFYASA